MYFYYRCKEQMDDLEKNLCISINKNIYTQIHIFPRHYKIVIIYFCVKFWLKHRINWFKPN